MLSGQRLQLDLWLVRDSTSTYSQPTVTADRHAQVDEGQGDQQLGCEIPAAALASVSARIRRARGFAPAPLTQASADPVARRGPP